MLLAVPLVLISTVSIEGEAMAAYSAAVLAVCFPEVLLTHRMTGKGWG